MDSFTCGFETRASPSNSLATVVSFRLMKLRNRFLSFATVYFTAITINLHLKPLFNFFVAHLTQLVGVQAIFHFCLGHRIANGLRTALGTATLAGAEGIDLLPFHVRLLQEGKDDVGAVEPPDGEPDSDLLVTAAVRQCSFDFRTGAGGFFHACLGHTKTVHGRIGFHRLDAPGIAMHHGSNLLGRLVRYA